MPDPLFGVLYRSCPQADGSIRLEFLSDHAERLLEATAEELQQQLLTQSVPLHGVDPAAFYASMVESLTRHAPWTAEFGYIGPKTGTVRWFRAQDFPQIAADGRPYFVGVLIEISELKRAEARASGAYQELSAHLAHTPLAVIEWDREGRIRRWCGLAESLFGWKAEEVLGLHLDEFRFVHEADAERVNRVASDLLKQVAPGTVCRNRNYHKSGRVVECLWHNSALADAAGQLVSVLSFAQDLTEQSAIEQELTLSEERLRSSLRFAGMLSWDYDHQTQSMHSSQSIAEYFGLPGLVAATETDYAIAHPDDRERIRAEVVAARETRNDFRIEYRGAKPDAEGRTQWFATRGSFVATSEGRVVRSLGVTSNITERKRIEQERAALDDELREARHLESLGLLAGGIAHDFNNLLTIILGNAGVVKMLTAGDDGVGKNLEEIETACLRAADLCSQITAYAGVGRLSAAEFDLNEMLREAEGSLDAAAGGHARLKWMLEPNPCLIVGEARQIRQATINLITNARESYGAEAGEIRIETERRRFDASPNGFAPAVAAGEYVALRVIDSGCGMTDEVRTKAFLAFFSTKFIGRGLGLAAVSGIVRDHKGSIRIRSEPGLGTTVELLFPLRNKAVDPAVIAPVEVRAKVNSQVLVADDDTDIRELICSVLEDEGYTVSAAANGADALAHFLEKPEAFQFAVIDLMMPGLTGQEVIRRARAVRPEFPIVVISGYFDRELTDDLFGGGPTRILPKPFRLEQFSETVRQLIASVRPS